jgi:bacterioferritin-associated ferredoxin
MICCVCVNVCEDKIREYIRNGFDTIEKLQEELDVDRRCKLCHPYIMNMIEEECQKEN